MLKICIEKCLWTKCILIINEFQDEENKLFAHFECCSVLSYPVTLMNNTCTTLCKKTLSEDFLFFLAFTAQADLLNQCGLISQAHSNETVGSVRWKIAKMLNSPVENIQIFANDSLVC